MSVESALSQLNIPIKKRLSNNRILTHCFITPDHEDKDPSCIVFLNTGVIYCHGCKTTSNITSVYKERFNIASYREANEMIFGSVLNINTDFINKNFTDNLKKEKADSYKKNINLDITTYPIKNPDAFQYMKLRGWNKKFIDYFHIEMSISNTYLDYAIIPIVSKKLNINTLEARKVLELKYLQKILKSDSENLDRLKAKFIKDKQLYKDSIYYKYLIQPKTYYPPKAPVTELIFNYDNLNFNEDVILVEGIASISKIWNNLTTNVSCTFGSKVSETQINILRQFKKRILLISDNDLASYTFIEKLNRYFDNIYVFDCYTKDTDVNFIDILCNSAFLKANDFLIKRGCIDIF
jgi:DNA primase